jgi:hypothetical protein
LKGDLLVFRFDFGIKISLKKKRYA